MKQNLFYDFENWDYKTNDINLLSKTGVYKAALPEELKNFLTGSHIFVFVFNLRTNGKSYCTQIAFCYFNFTIVKRNGYPKNETIQWEPWHSIM